MKYKVEDCPNPEVKIIHTSKLVYRGIHHFEKGLNDNERMPGLASDILKISGVISVSLHNYEIQVGKAELFDWKKLEPKILDVIKKTLLPKGKGSFQKI